MADEIVGKEKTSMVFAKYGTRQKECRRIVHAWLHKHNLENFGPIQELGSYKLLGSLLEDPAHFSDHIRT